MTTVSGYLESGHRQQKRPPSEFMRAPHNRESVANVLERIRAISGRVDAVGYLLEKHDIDQIEVQYQKELLRGLKALENWSNDAVLQISEVLTDRGAYNAGGAEVAKKPGRVYAEDSPKKGPRKKAAKKSTPKKSEGKSDGGKETQ